MSAGRRLPRPRVAWLIAVTEGRRRLRALRERTTQVVALLVSGLFVALALVAVAVAAFLAGGTPEAAPVESVARAAPASLWLLSTVLLAFRVLSSAADPDNRDGYLTTVPARDLFAGLAVVEAAVGLAYVVVPVVVAGAAFGAGSGRPFAAVAVWVAGVVPAVLGVATGLAAGFAVRNLSVRSRLVARLRVPLWLGGFAAYAAVFLTGRVESAVTPVVTAVTRPPFTWLSDLVAWGAGVGGAGRGPLAVALSITAALPTFAVAGWLARLLWYADGVETATEYGDGETRLAPGVFGRLARSETAWVARVATVRARRAPVKLLFVAYPVFLLAPGITQAVETGVVPGSLPPTVALFAAWAGGAGFALNPLGDQGATLPVAVTSGVSGGAFVRGVALPGAVLGGGLAAVAAAGLGAAAGFSLGRTALVAVVGVGLGAGAAALATGVGVVFPNHETTEVVRSREAVVPSLFAFAAYSILLLLVAAPAVVSAVPWAAEAVAGLVAVSPLAVSAVGAAVSGTVLAGLGWASLAYAGSKFDRYTV